MPFNIVSIGSMSISLEDASIIQLLSIPLDDGQYLWTDSHGRYRIQWKVVYDILPLSISLDRWWQAITDIIGRCRLAVVKNKIGSIWIFNDLSTPFDDRDINRYYWMINNVIFNIIWFIDFIWQLQYQWTISV